MKHTVGAPTAGNIRLEDGYYKVTAINALEKTSRAGNEMIEIEWQVVAPEQFYGAVVKDFLVSMDSMKWKTDQVIAALGLGMEVGDNVEIDPEDILDKTATARIEREPDKQDPQKTWPKIARYMWGDKAKNIPLGPDADDSDAPRPAARPAAAPAKPAARQPELQEQSDLDDEIPF